MFYDDLKENYTIVPTDVKDALLEEKGTQRTSKSPVPYRKKLLKKSILTLGLVGLCYFSIENFAYASDFDAKAEELYYGKFIGIAKWIIVGKGGWDTLNKTLKEDFDGAKKSFLQYGMIFATLVLLPTALTSVEDIIRG